MNLIISETQNVFIPKRYISNNAMIPFEALYYLKRKNKGKMNYAILKELNTYMSKVYNRVEWGFL